MALSRKSSIAYIPALDGLRAFAIVAVLIYHSRAAVPVLHKGGALGVDLFFVISGYLITTILVTAARNGRPIPARAFYLNRMSRLAPPLLIMLLVTLVPGLLWDPRGPIRCLLGAASAGLYLTPLTMGAGWSGLFQHTWSLGLEEYFYLTFPAFLALTVARPSLRKPVLFLVGSAALVISGLAHAHWADPSAFFDFLRVGAIAWGCFLALHLQQRPGWLSSPVIAPIGGALVIGGMALADTGSRFAGFGPIPVAAGACGLIAVAVAGRCAIVRLLAASPLRFVGIVSYEIYLWHYPVLLLAALASGEPVWAAALWAYPLTFALAVVTHKSCQRLRVRLRTAPSGMTASGTAVGQTSAIGVER